MTKGRNNFYLVSCILIRDANFFRHCVWCIFWKSDVYPFQKYHFHWYIYLTFEVNVSQKCQYRSKSGINLPYFIKIIQLNIFQKKLKNIQKYIKTGFLCQNKHFFLIIKETKIWNIHNFTQKKTFCEPTHDFTEI